MNLLARRVFPVLLMLGGLQAMPALACPNMTREQGEALHRKFVEEVKTATTALQEKADLIFIGRLSRLGAEQDTAGQPGLQHYQALFDVDEEIKGHYPAGQALTYTVNKNLVRMPIGCRPQYWQLPKENGAGESYLVYARGGEILRTNHIPTDTQTLSGQEEAEFVRGLR